MLNATCRVARCLLSLGWMWKAELRCIRMFRVNCLRERASPTVPGLINDGIPRHLAKAPSKAFTISIAGISRGVCLSLTRTAKKTDHRRGGLFLHGRGDVAVEVQPYLLAVAEYVADNLRVNAFCSWPTTACGAAFSASLASDTPC
jgi:hypothetical protein